MRAWCAEESWKDSRREELLEKDAANKTRIQVTNKFVKVRWNGLNKYEAVDKQLIEQMFGSTIKGGILFWRAII